MEEIKVIIEKCGPCDWVVTSEKPYRNCALAGYGETREDALVDFGICISEMVVHEFKENEKFPEFKFNFVER